MKKVLLTGNEGFIKTFIENCQKTIEYHIFLIEGDFVNRSNWLKSDHTVKSSDYILYVKFRHDVTGCYCTDEYTLNLVNHWFSCRS